MVSNSIYNKDIGHVLFDALHPSQQFSSQVGHFLSCISTKQPIKCLAQGHNNLPDIRVEPENSRCQVAPSTTKVLHTSNSVKPRSDCS